MEESQKETQTTTTPAPSTATTQTAVQDVVMEEATPASANNSNEKDNKVQTDPATAAMNNQRIVEEFQYLLEKSQQLFAGLR